MFESMEEFQMVLNELVGDKSMDKVRVEYEKLIHALKKSRENEKRLMSKCRELNAEIVSTSTKVAAALKISQEDETTITSLKRVYVIFKTCDVNIIQIFFLSLFIYCPDLIWQIKKSIINCLLCCFIFCKVKILLKSAKSLIMNKNIF